MIRFLSIIVFFLSSSIFLAEDYIYPYADGISKEQYQLRRNTVINKLSPIEMYVVFSADHYLVTEYQTFRQTGNLSYLAGATDNKTILLLMSNGIMLDNKMYNEILFVENQSDKDKLWHGVKMSKLNAEKILGIEKAMDYSKFDSIIKLASSNHSDLLISQYSKGVHFSPYVGAKNKEVEINIPIIELIKEHNPYLIISTEKSILKNMRAVKDKEEIRIMQKAIDISIAGHKRAMLSSQIGDYEYSIEAAMEGEFLRLGAENNGYNSIVGTGRNTCYLHYTASRTQTKDGDLVLIDCGAEYHGYTADITRTFPINGKFTKEQKIIYNIVLEAQELGISACKEGEKFFVADKICKDYIGEKLLELDIIKDKKDFKKYYPHGTSHYLGIDVHDIGNYSKLKAGNIITVEPGVYIPEGSDCDPKWWNIGVRIEDDILIRKNDAVNLSKALPRSVQEIEELLSKRKN